MFSIICTYSSLLEIGTKHFHHLTVDMQGLIWGFFHKHMDIANNS